MGNEQFHAPVRDRHFAATHPGTDYRCEQTRIRLERDWLFTFAERQRAEA